MLSKRHSALLAVAAIPLLLAGCGTTSTPSDTSAPEGATNDWAPITVDSWAGLAMDSERTTVEYEPLDAATEPWNICVSVPHVKDAYWLGMNYGVAQQAEAANVNLTFVEAGGYENLDKQIQQIEDCATSADALVIGAISYDGLNSTVERLVDEGKPVIDVINGISSSKITAKSLVSFYDLAQLSAQNILDEAGSDQVQVAWFPGPSGAGWAEDANLGFSELLEGTNVEIVDTKFGDTGKDTQSQLIEDALAANPDIDYIVGTAVTAEAAGPILKDRDLADQISVGAFYFTPGTLEGLERGTIQFAPSDSTAIQGRIAIDQAVRALEGADVLIHVGPELVMVTEANLADFDTTTTLAPDGYKPVFTVTAK